MKRTQNSHFEKVENMTCYSRRESKKYALLMATACIAAATVLTSCADAIGPSARNVVIPAPKIAEERSKAVNENGDPVVYLPLGDDVLVPQAEESDPLPYAIVGPYELRGETLAGALQLILDGTNIPIAFETEESLNKTITVTNLKGPLNSIVQEVCSLADMYCSYQNGMLVVKDTQVFTVAVPPITNSEGVSSLLTNISGAVGSITGSAPITDPSTRTIVYRASQRTSELARRYFQRLRSSTALVVFETYVWEVSLDSGNTTGIRWSLFDKVGRFRFGVDVAGAADTNVGSPISIGLPTTGSVDFDVNDVLQFVSSYGAVKTVSQPQITVLSGSTARLRVADTQNYVASLSRTTTDGGTTTVSTTTDSVDSGFTLEIGSNWDNSTVYGDINILLQEVRRIDTFDDNPDAVVQLPQTTERELETQVRIRPGDLLLIAGLVRETDALDKEGLGTNEPTLPFSRSAQAHNTELVFLLRPRVVVFTSQSEASHKKGAQQISYIMPPQMQGMQAQAPTVMPEPVISEPVFASAPAPEMVSDEVAPALPDKPVSTVPTEARAPKEFNQVIEQSAAQPLMEERVAAPQYETPKEPSTPAVEVNMPEEVSGNQTDPSVIVNYEVLGQ